MYQTIGYKLDKRNQMMLKERKPGENRELKNLDVSMRTSVTRVKEKKNSPEDKAFMVKE